nr:bifunctional folylpolyglutamate synthase/dihydrofolate synthase [Eubacterium sp.]
YQIIVVHLKKMNEIYNDKNKLLRNSRPDDIKPGLERISELLSRLDNPQEKLKIIQISGTNGKGSTGAYLSNILSQAGFTVGWFCSPSIKKEWDCIRIFPEENSFDDYDNYLNIINYIVMDMRKDGLEEPSVFEVQTALAYLYFYKKSVDIVVMETGLGGTYDATNVTKENLLSIITPIGLDHTKFLGDDIYEIAAHKAGIIKPGSVVVTCEDNMDMAGEVLKSVADENSARLDTVFKKDTKIIKSGTNGTDFSYRNNIYRSSLVGRHQAQNASLAIEASRCLKRFYPDEFDVINDNAITSGISKTRLDARCEILHTNPLVMYDGAHNPHGVRALKRVIGDIFFERDIYVICGVYKDKNYREMLDIIKDDVHRFIAVDVDGDRGLDADELLDAWMEVNYAGKPSRSMRDVKEAVKLVAYRVKQNNPSGVILVFGSLSMYQEVLAVCDEI